MGMAIKKNAVTVAAQGRADSARLFEHAQKSAPSSTSPRAVHHLTIACRAADRVRDRATKKRDIDKSSATIGTRFFGIEFNHKF